VLDVPDELLRLEVVLREVVAEGLLPEDLGEKGTLWM